MTHALPDRRRWEGWTEHGAPVIAHVVERCAYCSFSASGPVEQMRQAFAEHVCDRPAPPAVSRRRRDGFVLRR